MKSKPFIFLILYSGDDWYRRVPWSKKYAYYREAYEKWSRLAATKDIDMVRASLRWYDATKKEFRKAWQFDGSGKWRRIYHIKPDFIYRKTKTSEDLGRETLLGRDYPIFNSPLVGQILDNKGIQAILFREFMLETHTVSQRSVFKETIARITGNKVVIKPLGGTGGFGIFIGDKKKALQNEGRFTYPVLVQKFIKAGSVPGVTRGLADLRLVFLNRRFIYACTRVAKKGSLFTNVHQGAVTHIVPNDKIPVSAMAMANKINKKLFGLGPLADYSLDFLFTAGGQPKLIESNSGPGVFFEDKDWACQKRYFLRILTFAKSTCANK